MNTLRPDHATLEKLIALSQCADDDPHMGDIVGTFKVNPYVRSIHSVHGNGLSATNISANRSGE